MFLLSLLVGTALVADARETPVEKVISMLAGLQEQVQEEGKAEAKTYDEFACFCKSKTDAKVLAIEEGQENVAASESAIEKALATRTTKNSEISDLNDDIKTLTNELDAMHAARENAKATFEAAFADMTGAVSALERAITTLKAGKTSLLSVKQTLRTTLLMADALDLSKQNKKAVSLLSDDGFDVPTSDYDFHSGDIVTTLESLLKEFRAKKIELDDNNAKAQSDHDLAFQAKSTERKVTQENLENRQKEVAGLTSTLAQAQSDLTTYNALLNDDRVYLKDLTGNCEGKAKAWDQRTDARAAELAALTQALSVLRGTVAEQAGKTGAGGRSEATPETFLQLTTVVRRVHQQPEDEPKDELRERLVELLSRAGQSLKSVSLASLAAKARADPFVKIKGMIQSMIEKLLAEEADEAGAKGQCDEDIAKAVKDRDYRLRDVTDLHNEIEQFNARIEKLTQQIDRLETEHAELTDDLKEATRIRDQSRADHAQTVTDSEAGLEAVKNAIDILAHFYGAANKNTVGEFVQQPDAPDAGFANDEAYTGSQSASTGILGMLDVIKSDFERSISETEAQEATEEREFRDFNAESRASLAAKQNAVDALNSELDEAEDNNASAGQKIRTQQSMLDNAVKAWQELIHPCREATGTAGGSYDDRVARREAEVQALKDAYCILNNEDAGCSGVFLQKRLY